MFQIQTPTAAHMASFNVRNELHGEDQVLAFSMKLKITGANTFLDAIAPTLRESLYKAVDGQDQLPGVEPSTPLLRCKLIEAAALSCAFDGWTLRVQHGIDEASEIVIGGCKVDKFRVTPKDGGTCETEMRLGSNDIDEGEIGKLAGKLGQEVTITLAAPEPKADKPAIDGTTAAFKKDYPNAGEPDATDMFVAGASGGGDGEAGDDAGGAAEDDANASGDDAAGNAPAAKKSAKARK